MTPKNENRFYYLPIGPQELEWGLYVTGVGSAVSMPRQKYPPPGHPSVYDFAWSRGRVLAEYQAIYLSGGGGVFESAAMGQVPVSAGDMILLSPGVWHRYRPLPEAGWMEHWVGFNGEYPYRLYRLGIFGPDRAVVRVADGAGVLAGWEEIFNRAPRPGTPQSPLMAAGVMTILAHAAQSLGRGPAKGLATPSGSEVPEDDLVAQAVGLIWSHSHRNTMVRDLIDALGVTRRTLERRFRLSLGRTIGQEIARCRIERAKHLLRQTRLPIEHIALAVGFSGADRMGKVFRRVEGQSPGRCRQGRAAGNAGSGLGG